MREMSSDDFEAHDFAPRILCEHDGTIVWNKPAGLAATGRNLDDPACAQFLAMQHYRRMIWAVHQLDTETSGVLVFVRRKGLVSAWQKRLAARSTVKRYVAIVHGRLPRKMMIVREPVGGKEARSDFRELAYRDGASLLEVCIHTGRTHQIRVHLEGMGLQLFGEKRYGGAPCNAHERHALHAVAIVFRVEEDAGEGGNALERGRLEAPLPEDMVVLAQGLGLDLGVLRG